MKQPIEKALQVARENLREIRTVGEWADKMGYDSSKYFSRKFKKHFGIPPKPKLVELRIEKFQQIVEDNPHATCFEVGFELGIGDEKDLNRYIKNHTGKPPTEWKNGE
ncbi:MAG TPA: hypothetical protein DD671_14740 [Balneolaceae bacterium]|nr:hypothetical protein [Balneola sp.]HBQ60832.1 hypothetical protein [Balneolaceae bacterium]|tara:strand:- start:51971 stop:52294 length:324 start_codon:yes stop_codon:yes gene_type:complete